MVTLTALRALRVRLALLILPRSHTINPVPSGFRLVPYKPTTRMKRAACSAMSPGKRPNRWVSNRLKHEIRYRAMLDAYHKDGSL